MHHLSPQIVKHLNVLADALSGARLPDLPGLESEQDVPELNGAQIRQVLRASRLGRGITVRVTGARDFTAKAPQRPRKAKA